MANRKGSRKERRPKRKPRVVTRERPGSLENLIGAVLRPAKGQKVVRVVTKRSPAQPGLLITPTKQNTDG